VAQVGVACSHAASDFFLGNNRFSHSIAGAYKPGFLSTVSNGSDPQWRGIAECDSDTAEYDGDNAELTSNDTIYQKS
jgi:hypothetical protein